MELEDLPWVGRLVLAEASGIETSLTAANELAIRRAFEAAGVEFTNGDQPGLRLTRTAAARPQEPGDRSKTQVGANIGCAKPTTKRR